MELVTSAFLAKDLEKSSVNRVGSVLLPGRSALAAPGGWVMLLQGRERIVRSDNYNNYTCCTLRNDQTFLEEGQIDPEG